MSHNHNHNHKYCCEHENVKYCKVCKVVHCLDCKKEWSEYTFYYNPYPSWIYTTTTPTTQPNYISIYDTVTNTGGLGTMDNKTICNHN